MGVRYGIYRRRGRPPFEHQPMAWQTATVYFAVIELVAAVGLWLATPWGAVGVADHRGVDGGDRTDVSGHRMVASLTVVGMEAVMLAAYLALAWMAARERPP